MQRYFVDPVHWHEDEIEIADEDAAHIAKVMRMSPGDRVYVCDNQGRTVLAELIRISPSVVHAKIVEGINSSEPNCQLTLVQGLPKSDKLEYILQKGTEVGVHSFALIESERTVAHYDASKINKKMDRWRKITKEAAEQSHRSSIPAIAPPVKLESWTNDIANYDLVLVCYEGAGLPGLRTAIDEWLVKQKPENDGAKPISIAVCIGPEGGFSTTEIEQISQSGGKAITLGPRILRTETAGVVAASLILYHLGDMGG